MNHGFDYQDLQYLNFKNSALISFLYFFHYHCSVYPPPPPTYGFWNWFVGLSPLLSQTISFLRSKSFKHPCFRYTQLTPLHLQKRFKLIKFDPRLIKCIFLGYSCAQKGYKCYSPTLRWHFISADVTFLESTYYFSSSPSLDSSLPCLLCLPPMSPPDTRNQKPLQVYCLSTHI